MGDDHSLRRRLEELARRLKTLQLAACGADGQPTLFAETLGELARELDMALQEVAQGRLAEDRVRAAESLAAVGDTAAVLAREARGAFQRSGACLDLLAMDLQDRPAALDLIARAREAHGGLRRLLAELQECAAPVRLRRRVCDPGVIVQEAWSRLAPLRQGRAARLRESGETDLLCEADPLALGEAFSKVLEHSLAACADPVEIELHWSAAELGGEPAIRAAFRDNGPGFTPAERDLVFEPFRAARTRRAGLGMALVRRLVEAHGGEVALGSPPGGTEVLLTLPRGACGDPAAGPHEEAGELDGQATPCRSSYPR